jgi:hypothetical protein
MQAQPSGAKDSLPGAFGPLHWGRNGVSDVAIHPQQVHLLEVFRQLGDGLAHSHFQEPAWDGLSFASTWKGPERLSRETHLRASRRVERWEEAWDRRRFSAKTIKGEGPERLGGKWPAPGAADEPGAVALAPGVHHGHP